MSDDPSEHDPGPDGATERRLHALQDLHILDTAPELVFDDIVAIASTVCEAPIALVSLVEKDRQWFKARVGLEAGQTPIEHSVCDLAIRQSDVFVIPDLLADPRTAGNRLVTHDPHIRFYAGAPIHAPDGTAIGTLCVIDVVPRALGLTQAQTTTLTLLARQVTTQLLLRRMVDREVGLGAYRATLRDAALDHTGGTGVTIRDLQEREARARRTQEAARIGSFELDIATGLMAVSDEFCRVFGVPIASTYPASVFEAIVLPEDSKARSDAVSRASGTAGTDTEYRIRRPDDGRIRWLSRRSQFLHDDDGRPVALFGTAHDITDRKLATLRLTSLLQLDDEVRGLRDRIGVLEAAARLAGTALAASQVGYADIEDRLDTMPVLASWPTASPPGFECQWRKEDFSRTLAALRHGATVVTGDVERDTVASGDVSYAQLGAKAAVFLPVMRGNRLAGTFFVLSEHPRPWSTNELAFIQGMLERLQSALQQLDAEKQRIVLTQELSHRLKNSLATVQAIVMNSLAEVQERDLVDALAERIVALSKAHRALVANDWASAGLVDLVSDLLSNISVKDRIDVVGPDLEIGGRAAQSMSLTLHELATNAMKYGALSNAEGRVKLSWALVPSETATSFVLRWRETGGPQVVPPAHAGFGLTLIRMGLVGTGGVELHYHPAGVEAVFEARLDDMQET